MVRQLFMRSDTVAKVGFRQRGKDVSRIESFSDTVFGFAITLLVISLTPIANFADLMKIIDGLLAFGIEFSLIVSIWLLQYQFFRRYNLQDPYTIALNMLLLFVTLFYVYPLRFMFSVVTFSNGTALQSQHIIDDAQVLQLFIIYGVGYSAVFVLFTLMLLHAYRQSETLGLTAMERFDTRSSIMRNLTFVAIGLLSILLALTHIGSSIGAAGWIYGLILPVLLTEGRLRRRQRRVLQAHLAETPVDATTLSHP